MATVPPSDSEPDTADNFSPLPIVVVAAMASVLRAGDAKRVTYLRACLDSILKQTTKPDHIFVAIHCEDASVLGDLQRDYPTEISNVQFIVQAERQSQFRNYQALVEHAGQQYQLDPLHTYFLFSDDDDLWHEERVEWYKQRVSNGLYWPDDDSPPIIHCGHVYRSKQRDLATALATEDSVNPDCKEYCTFAVPYRVVRRFFAKHAAVRDGGARCLTSVCISYPR